MASRTLADLLVLVHLEFPMQVGDGDPESKKPVEHRRETVADLVKPPSPDAAPLQSVDKVREVPHGDRSRSPRASATRKFQVGALVRSEYQEDEM